MRFIVDAMLGNVARELRLLGYDAYYVRRETDARVLRLAQAQSRTLLTCDHALKRRAGKMPALFVDEKNSRRQTAWALKSLGLNPDKEGVESLSRCLECGTALRAIDRDEVTSRVPEYIAATQGKFAVCDDCGRVYWPGTHAQRMLVRAAEIIDELNR